MASMFFLTIDNHFDHTIFWCRCVVTAVLVAAAGTHARNRHVGFSFWQAVPLKLLNKLKELHATYVIGNAPERPLGRVRHYPSGLCVNQFIVITQTCGFYLCLVLTAVNRLNGLAHDTVITGNNGVFQAQINIPLFIECSLEKTVSPCFNLINTISRQHPWIAFVEGATMQLDGITAAPDEDNFGNASRV